jgi:hypothetical protein
MKKSVI